MYQYCLVTSRRLCTQYNAFVCCRWGSELTRTLSLTTAGGRSRYGGDMCSVRVQQFEVMADGGGGILN